MGLPKTIDSMQVIIILSVFGFWLIVMSVVLGRVLALFKKLTRGVEEDLAKKGFGEVRKRLDILESESKNHIQKVGLVRFNPFKELGGDHSFSLAILDEEKNGILITSLHTRDRTRVYMKQLVKGKGETELSEEEQKAVSKAK